MEKEEKKGKKKKMILLGVGTLATGILGYFGWQYWQNRKIKKEEPEALFLKEKPSLTETASFIPVSKPVPASDAFPLKKGSKGIKVKALQEALIAKYGKTLLPKYGADGDFGSEMAAALTKLNLPEIIDESTFNVIIKGNAIDAKKVAESIYKAAASKNFNQVIFTLKGMKSSDDYSSVSEAFKNYRIQGVRQTLVNGLLNSFPEESEKQQIRLEFARMGLKYDGAIWSLSGLEEPLIITKEPAIVWKNSKEGYKVPASMVLGRKIKKINDYTLFENNGQNFLVKTQSIKNT